jgi:hypothetical protein
MQNFKSWRDTGDLEIAPLTGLFGTNNSGKTSIMQMLLMLKQTVESSDRRRVLHTGDERSLVDLGTFRDVIYGHRLEEALTLGVSWEGEQSRYYLIGDFDDFGVDIPLKETNFSFMSSIRQVDERIMVDRFVYELHNTHKKFGMFRVKDDEYAFLDGEHQLKPRFIYSFPPPMPIKCYGLPDVLWASLIPLSEEQESITEQLSKETLIEGDLLFEEAVTAFETLFDQIAYLGPLREHPKRIYLWGGDFPSGVGQRGENAIDTLLASRIDDREDLKTIEINVLRHLQNMGLIHSFELRRLAEGRREYEFVVKMHEDSAEVLLTDVGFGISQILPVLVLCYYVPEGSILLLEQPEMHLHPSAQAGLADVLIDVVNNRNVQIIVESHSEHLLARLQRRIAEEAISPEKTALYFCKMEAGESKIDRLQLDEYGNISNWPKDFFGDEMGDRSAMVKAAMQRQIANRR